MAIKIKTFLRDLPVLEDDKVFVRNHGGHLEEVTHVEVTDGQIVFIIRDDTKPENGELDHVLYPNARM